MEELLEADAGPIILAGDFNSQPGSAVIGRLRSGWAVLAKGDDAFTYPSFGPEREIDFIMVRPADRLEVLAHWALDEPVASDHRPILADLVLRD